MHRQQRLVTVTASDGLHNATPICESLKWKCEVCTYENWPASIRCAMCQSTNSNKVLTENQHNNRKLAAAASAANNSVNTNDIFKMGATSLSRSTSPQLLASPAMIAQQTQVTGDDPKWPCPLCTYLNWPKTLRCTQCHTPRRRVSPGIIRLI